MPCQAVRRSATLNGAKVQNQVLSEEDLMPVPGHQSVPLNNLRDYQHIEVDHAGLALGAYVSGVDLREIQPTAVYEEIAQALWAHNVLFFRNQELTPESHMKLAGHFGTPEAHEIFKSDDQYPEISILENDADKPPEINVWHTDVTFRKAPTLCSVLYCEVAPRAGGDTLFASAQVAFDSLSAPIQDLLLGLEMEHDVLQVYTGTDMLTRAGGAEHARRLSESHPPVVHPAIVAHPVTGRAGLFVNPTHGKHFLGMSKLESRRLMDLICEHQQLPEFQVRFTWEPGSIAIWDNFATQHYAVADYYPQHRRMRRVTVSGAEPKAYRKIPLASAA